MARKTRRDKTQEQQAPKRARPPRSASSSKPETQGEQGFLFDPYWDEAFSAYYDPTLRTCCQLKY
jgi:hypothetical protein